jgi:DNA-binding response OmpR family regulator
MSKNILIVEDDLDIAENLKALLTLEGYSSDISKDGLDALNRLRDGSPRPSLILLDLMMPVMDGFQFYREQQSDPTIAGIPVVVMTAGGNVEAKVQKMGIQAYFRKPLDVDKLFATIERLVSA